MDEELDLDGGDWYDESCRAELEGPPPNEVMYAVWQLETWLGHCMVDFRAWRQGPAGADWASRLSGGPTESADDQEGLPWTAA